MRNFKDRKFEKRDSKPRREGPTSDRAGMRTPKRFDKNRSGTFSKGQLEMHRAICDKCGETCAVPFKPSQDKPVYCSNCFKKGDNNDSFSPKRSERFDSPRSSSEISKKDFDQLNSKLDKILEILENN